MRLPRGDRLKPVLHQKVNLAETVMPLGLLENTCDGLWKTDVDGMVKLWVAVSVNPIGATSLK